MPSTKKRRALHSGGPDAWQETVTTIDGQPGSSTLIATPKWKDSANARLWQGSQETDSEEHPGWHRSRGRQDIGGNFTTRKRYLETDIASLSLYGKRSANGINAVRRYRGPILAAGTAQVSSLPGYVDRSDAILNQRGAEAVARCKPTNAVADLSVALGELYRERLPSITRWDQIKYETDKARRAGSEYLKSEFGWMPLLGELNDFIRAVTHAGELLSQYERDAGRVVRRQYTFPPERSSTSSTLSVSSPALLGVDPSGYRKPGTVAEGRVVKTVETVRKTWFSGAFSYTLPVGYNSHDALVRQAARASVLYGAELTPSTVWNLAPWSWAVDWFSNVGDVLSNASDYLFDGLVMRYGYIMEHSLVRETYAYYGESNFQTPVQPQTLSFVAETKKRRQANPFGFGVSWNGLTPRQIAISVALGLTKK